LSPCFCGSSLFSFFFGTADSHAIAGLIKQDLNNKFPIMSRSSLFNDSVLNGAKPNVLSSFLKLRLRILHEQAIVVRIDMREHVLLKKMSCRLDSHVKIERSDKGFEQICQQCLPMSTAKLFLASTK